MSNGIRVYDANGVPVFSSAARMPRFVLMDVFTATCPGGNPNYQDRSIPGMRGDGNWIVVPWILPYTGDMEGGPIEYWNGGYTAYFWTNWSETRSDTVYFAVFRM